MVTQGEEALPTTKKKVTAEKNWNDLRREETEEVEE